MSTAVAKNSNIRDTLRQMKDQFALALPSVCTPERFVRVALTTVNKNPALERCTPTSILGCFMDLASLGLEPDGRRAHIIPYGDKATLIIDYKGLIELAKRNGDVLLWRPVAVKANDKFKWTNGQIEHEIDWLEDRGPLKAVYSHVKTKDGTDDYEVMTLAECEAIRKRSRAGGSGPWVTDFEAMCLKTVMRRHSKRLVLSPEFRDALDKDQDELMDLTTTRPAEVVEQKPMFAKPEEPEVLPPAKQEEKPEDDDEVPMGDPPTSKEVLIKAINSYCSTKANLKLAAPIARSLGIDMNSLEDSDEDVLAELAKNLGV